MTMLTNRAVLRLSPTDPAENVATFLQGLVTNDVVKGPLPAYAALLTPQGKVIADFIVWADGADLLLDVAADQADLVAKRLSMYRLRRAIAIGRDDTLAVHWAADAAPGAVADPRLPDLGWRWIAPGDGAAVDAAWTAHRLSHGVAEGVELADLLWLECNAAELNGVSFTKGCYVGQENTARMNWRQKVNRRLIVVPLASSDPARQRAAWPDLGLALDHLRVEDIVTVPGWLASSGTTVGDQSS
ncbi:folate-binding protein [Novosphingobium sp. FSY-8]|uniref:Folate-binding protein n=1 Tax=Novosphingobium ovatum TaxID=1908523 RepID=A0ABW9XD61_9SPHN|nr:folate-binding protein YgfZ [Novosphingobium ovatum]NBC36492.1 folate-binding protein [Novosphingobium ovatum]